jgi:hypothetical protein
VQRWLVMTLGLGLALAAGYVLLSAAPGPRVADSSRRTTTAAAGAGGGGSSDHIDARSREALQRILREADDEASGRP